jgi:hypothetical protein
MLQSLPENVKWKISSLKITNFDHSQTLNTCSNLYNKKTHIGCYKFLFFMLLT